ncbi:FG-GAP-like repeat-containing protein [Arcobacter sp. LA11]|uniref:FG-GAP-like repeat-containing protein n=1 Tax=Arcobacter sp. LA11 TaxID=1898176 RepID=UPI000933EB6E|nr:FG-GAP-like repeat-containing protein [Arcobacter sp. LA11]
MKRLLVLSLLFILSVVTNVNAQIVGATKGKFNVSNGTASYSLEIVMPKGTAGLKPSLSIDYSSSNNFNGLLGVGFSLSGLSQISKCNQTLFSEKKDSSRNYNYCIDGQKLVTKNSSTTYGSNTTYKTEVDTYAKIVKTSTNWTVYTKDGLIYEYGKTTDSNDSNTFFRVNKIKDRYNNEINFKYDTTTKALLQIAYANNAIDLIYEDRTDTKTLYQRGVKVNLLKRLKKVSVKTNGFETSSYNLDYQTINRKSILSSITETIDNKSLQPIIFNWNNFNESTLVKKDSFPSGVFPQGKKSKYFPADYNGDGLADILALNYSNSSYSWVAIANENGTFTKKSFSGYPLDDDTKYYPADYNGDGLTDMLAMHYKGYKNSSLSWIALSNGDGTFTKKEGLTKYFKNFGGLLDPYGMQKIRYYTNDYNGDGRADIAAFHYMNKDASFVLLSNGDGTFTKNTDVSKFDYHKEAKIHLGDFNADGFMDIVSFYNTKKISYSETDLEKYSWIALSNGDGTFTKKNSFNNFDVSYASLSTYYLADYNGDGFTDIFSSAYSTMGSNEGEDISSMGWIGISNGDTTFTKKSNINLFGQYAVGKNFYLGDYNGDGISDIAYINTKNRHNNTIALSKGDGSFVKNTQISDFRMNDATSIFPIDYNGDGLTDLMSINYDKAGYRYVAISKGDGTFTKKDLSTQISMDEYSQILPSDYNGDGLTDLVSLNYNNNSYSWSLQSDANKLRISSITNNKDEDINLEYSSLSDKDIYSSTNNLSFPNRSIKNSPMQVVKSYTTSDGIGGVSKTSYKYKDFAINLERGSLGFEEIETINETTNSKSIVIYNQNYPYIGTPKESKAYVNNKLMSKSTEIYTQVTNASSDSYQLHKIKSTSYSYSYDSGNQLVKKETINSDIDSYGNIGRIETITEGNGKTFKKTIQNTYSNYESSWILSRLDNSKVIHEALGKPSITRESEFEYDTLTGTLVKEVIEPNDVKSLSKSYVYDSHGNKISETISASNMTPRTTTFTYDTYGKNQIKITNLLGHSETKTYNNKDQVISVTGPNGLTTTFAYDEMGRKIKETRADGNYTTWEYSWTNDGHKVIQKLNGKFPVTVFYDKLGRKLKTIKVGFDGRNIIEEIEYDYRGNKAKVSTPYFEDEEPEYINYSYDDINRLVRLNSPGSHDTRVDDTIEYTDYSTIKTNANGQIKTTTVNVLEKTVFVNDNSQSTITYEYDAIGNLLKTIDSKGNEIIIEYDNFGNKTKQIDPDMGIWTYNYNALKQLVSQTDAKAQVTSFTYDTLGRVLTKTIPEGIIEFKYDIGNKGLGKIVEEKGIGSVKKYTYDNLGRVNTVTTRIDDSYDYIKQYTYDSLGRVSKTIEPNNVEIKNNYNEHGYLDSVTTPRRNAGVVSADRFRDEIAYDMQQYLENKKLSVEYTAKINKYNLDVIRYTNIIELYKDNPAKADIVNQLKNHVNELKDLIYTLEGVVSNYNKTTNTLNEANLQQWLNGSDSAELATLYATFKDDLINIAEYSVSLLEELKVQKEQSQKLLYCGNVDGIIIFCPDEMSHDSTIYTKEDNLLFYGTSAEIVSFYETALSNLTSDVNYIKDLNQKVRYYEELSNAYTNKASAYTEILESDDIYFYKVLNQNSLGIITSYLSGNGLETTAHYDRRGIVYSMKTGYDSSTEEIRNLSFEYDSLNNVSRRVDSKLDVEHNYIYDSLNRLTYANIDTKGTSSVLSYQYDEIGNMTYKSDIGHYEYNTSRPHAVSSIGNKTFTYDANGNMTNNDGKIITYSSFNKPIKIESDNKIVTFDYDANNKRFKKTSGSDTIHYLGKSYEKNFYANGVSEDKYFIYANGKLVSIFSNKSDQYSAKFLHYDNLGSVDTITDNLGVVVERRAYKPFGKQLNLDKFGNEVQTTSPTTNRGFTGHEHINEVGLIHMNGRVYDPTIARFLSADPHIQDSKDTQSYNRYTYVKNNPLKYTDPSGFFFKSIKKLWKKISKIVVIAIISYFTAGAASAWVAGWGTSFGTAAGMGALTTTTLGSVIAGAITGAVTGFASGFIMTGSLSGALKGAAFGVLGGGIAGAIGDYFGHSSSLLNGGGVNAVKKAIAHGISRAGINKLQGGKWNAGFWSGFTASAFSPGTTLGGEDSGGFILRTTIAGVIGGTASELSGGKFANGAVSAAFVHMFNAEAITIMSNALTTNKIWTRIKSLFKLKSEIDLLKFQTEIDSQLEYLSKKASASGHYKFANDISRYRVKFMKEMSKSFVRYEMTGVMDVSNVLKVKGNF